MRYELPTNRKRRQSTSTLTTNTRAKTSDGSRVSGIEYTVPTSVNTSLVDIPSPNTYDTPHRAASPSDQDEHSGYSPAPSAPPTQESNYGTANCHKLGDFLTITSVKPKRLQGNLVWVHQLAGQYCHVLASNGEHFKKLHTCLAKLPPATPPGAHLQFHALKTVVLAYNAKLLDEQPSDCQLH